MEIFAFASTFLRYELTLTEKNAEVQGVCKKKKSKMRELR